ncbi:hypothetical protein BDR26DRAFT_662455 [Obelidium mucronatum]|nr:hypothetical protein BDR26DRAFT_662455 [Obelidium mucronatum]
MSLQHLNLSHNGIQAQVNITGLTCMTDLQKEAKFLFPINTSPVFIQFRTDSNLNATWSELLDLPIEYSEVGGNVVVIHVAGPTIATTSPIEQSANGSLKTKKRNLNNGGLRDYLARGFALKNDRAVLAIVDCLQTMVTRKNRDEVPFVFLESSSGLGKTQTSFALIHALSVDIQVFYLLYSVANSATQPVFKSFLRISNFFGKCVEMDSSHYVRGSPGCLYLIDEQLYVFGFIKLLLEQFKKSNALEVVEGTFVAEKMSGKKLRKYIKSKYPSSNLRPTFIIDECNIDKGQIEKFRFVRNTFRCLGVCLVMLGTDSQAAKLGDSMGSASRWGEAFVWCHIFNKLPRLHVPSLKLAANLPQDIHSVITKSRPWFAHLGARYWATAANPSFNTLLSTVYGIIIKQKRIFKTDFGRLGQIHLFQNTSFVSDNSSSLIHQHFGELDGLQNFTLDNEMCNSETLEDWIPSAIFPQLKNDPLLFLCLMGSPGCPAFVIDSKRVPYSYFLYQHVHSIAARQHSVNFGNAVQKGNDGTEFESRLTACLCLASHSGGVNGVSVVDFLQDLVYNLRSVKSPTADLTVNLLQLPLSPLKGFIVPFLSPPNQEWPPFIESCGSFANLWRARNRDMVDILTSCGLSAEVKDWTNPLSSKVLADIILRAPVDSKLHIVLVRTLQTKNFTTQDYAMAVGNHSKRFAVCKVDLGCDLLDISEIGGIPVPQAPSGVILFILCPN